MKKSLFLITCALLAIAGILIYRSGGLPACSKCPPPQIPAEKKSASMAKYDESGLPKFIMGACTHFWQGKGILQKNIDMLKSGGFNALRDEGTWGAVERKKGEYSMPNSVVEYIDAAVKEGVAPLLILDYANPLYNNGGYPETDEAIEGFAKYAEFTANRFKGKIPMYQVWNEWDGGCGMPKEFQGKSTAAGYAKLLEKTYAAIKAQDPAAMVMMNSICKGDSFFEESLATGVLKNCDIASLHTYNYSQGKSLNDAEAWYARMLGVEKLLRKYNGGELKPLVITEMGFPNQTNNIGSSYERTAEQSARIYLLARTLPWLKGIFWYDFQDDGNSPMYNEDNFGIVRPDLTPKPAFSVLQTIADIVKNADFVRFEDVGDENVWIVRFNLRGEDVLAMWNTNEGCEISVTLKSSAKNPAPLKVFLAGSQARNTPWGLRDFTVNRAKKTDADKVAFSLRSMPLIVRGDLSKIAIDKIAKMPYNTKRAATMFPKTTYAVPSAPQESAPYDFSHNTVTPWKPAKKVYDGIGDISAKFAASYSGDCLNLKITVTDDKHVGAEKDKGTDASDYVKIAINSDIRLNQNVVLKIVASPDGALVSSPSQAFSAAPQSASATVERVADKTVYNIKISPQLLGLKSFERGKIIACAILVNDNDGDGESLDEQVMLRWSSAMSRNGTNQNKFNALILD